MAGPVTESHELYWKASIAILSMRAMSSEFHAPKQRPERGGAGKLLPTSATVPGQTVSYGPWVEMGLN